MHAMRKSSRVTPPAAPAPRMTVKTVIVLPVPTSSPEIDSVITDTGVTGGACSEMSATGAGLGGGAGDGGGCHHHGNGGGAVGGGACGGACGGVCGG